MTKPDGRVAAGGSPVLFSALAAALTLALAACQAPEEQSDADLPGEEQALADAEAMIAESQNRTMSQDAQQAGEDAQNDAE